MGFPTKNTKDLWGILDKVNINELIDFIIAQSAPSSIIGGAVSNYNTLPLASTQNDKIFFAKNDALSGERSGAYYSNGTTWKLLNNISADEIKALYESLPNTNAFTDSEKTKLAAITNTFLGLTDTPADFTGQGNKFIRVNVAENGLEFAASASSSTDLRNTFNCTANQLVYVLSNIPILNSEIVSLNGVEIYKGVSYDYTLSGNIITLNAGWNGNIFVGDVLSVKYLT